VNTVHASSICASAACGRTRRLTETGSGAAKARARRATVRERRDQKLARSCQQSEMRSILLHSVDRASAHDVHGQIDDCPLTWDEVSGGLAAISSASSVTQTAAGKSDLALDFPRHTTRHHQRGISQIYCSSMLELQAGARECAASPITGIDVVERNRNDTPARSGRRGKEWMRVPTRSKRDAVVVVGDGIYIKGVGSEPLFQRSGDDRSAGTTRARARDNVVADLRRWANARSGASAPRPPQLLRADRNGLLSGSRISDLHCDRRELASSCARRANHAP